jgi:polar amino acid transport system substrate-binding protein
MKTSFSKRKTVHLMGETSMKQNFNVLRRALLASAIALVGMLGMPRDVSAQTLEAVKARGKVIIGVQGDNVPFGFLDSTGKNAGYDVDIGTLFGQYLGVPVEFQVVTNQNRIAALQTRKVDVLFATLGMSADRAKSLQYSKPYAANVMQVLAKKSSKIGGPQDLNDVPLGVPKASTQEIVLTEIAPKAKFLRFDDDSSTIQALLSGQVDAVGASQFYLARVDELRPGVYENKFPIKTNYNGAGTILGDKAWNETVNKFLDQINSNGKLAELYRKWMKLDPPAWPASLEGIPFEVK